MVQGDLVSFKRHLFSVHASDSKRVYIVARCEPENGWVFIYGSEVPIQGSLLEVISKND